MATLTVKIRPAGDLGADLDVQHYDVPDEDLEYLDTAARVEAYAGSRWPSSYELVDFEVTTNE